MIRRPDSLPSELNSAGLQVEKGTSDGTGQPGNTEYSSFFEDDNMRSFDSGLVTEAEHFQSAREVASVSIIRVALFGKRPLHSRLSDEEFNKDGRAFERASSG